MDKRTIGQFIAVLRKASGMSQRELGERLNVSDKTISRWERDESAPDLTLIPVLAEIFQITADELLRGERNPAMAAAPTSYAEQKRDKQQSRLLQETKTRHQIRSLAALGIAGAGLAAAAIANLGCNRALVGFLLALAFAGAAMICELIFVIRAFAAVGESEEAGDAINQSRFELYRRAKQTLVAIGGMLGFCVPLCFAGDAYLGLQAGSWLIFGSGTAVAATAMCMILGLAVDTVVLDRPVFRLGEKQTKVFERKLSIGKWCAGVTAFVMFFTFLANLAMTGTSEQAWAEGVFFDDYAAFGAYMEQDIPEEAYSEYDQTAPVSYETYDGAYVGRRHSITDGDGNVLFTFNWNNRQVSTYSFSLDNQTKQPRIYAYTQAALDIAGQKIRSILHLIYGMYVLEMLAGIIVSMYLKKRRA